jgi:hypothetical protein
VEDDMDGYGPRVRGNGRLRGVGAAGILLAVGALAVSGCAGDKPPSKAVASVAATGSASAAPSGKADPVAFARCMRANGLPDFPDPDTGGSVKVGGGGGKGGGIDPSSPEFKSANEKCKQYMPTQIGSQPGQDPWPLDSKLKYAKCMRANGLPNFPDPGRDGQFPHLDKGSALGPESAQFRQADKACAKDKPQGGSGGAPGGGS